MLNNKISVAIIGLGEMGFFNDLKIKNNYKSHFKSIKKNKFFKLKVLIESDLKKLSKIVTPGIKKFTQINNELKKIAPDLVIISTNTNSHYNVFLKLIKFYIPKVILFEKPFGNSLHESKHMNLIAKKFSIKIFINFIRESNPGYIKIKKFLFKNRNNFTNISLQYNNSFQNNASHWFVFFNNIYGSLNSIIDLNIGKKNPTKNVLLKFTNANINFIQSSKVINNNFYLTINSKNFYISINSNEDILLTYKTNKKITHLHIKTNMHRYQSFVYENITSYFLYKKYNLISSNEAFDKLKVMYKVMNKFND